MMTEMRSIVKVSARLRMYTLIYFRPIWLHACLTDSCVLRGCPQRNVSEVQRRHEEEIAELERIHAQQIARMEQVCGDVFSAIHLPCVLLPSLIPPPALPSLAHSTTTRMHSSPTHR